MNKKSVDVASLWVGGCLSQFEIASLKSFLQHGHSLTLFTYDTGISVPDGVHVRDARDVVMENEIFSNQNAGETWAGFSNFFRYELLRQSDYVWVDTDVIALSNEIPTRDGYVLGWESEDSVNGAVLGAPRDSVFLECLPRLASLANPAGAAWGELGPVAITKSVRFASIEDKVQAERAFYPLSWPEVWRLFDPGQTSYVVDRTSESSTLHWWNEILRRALVGVKDAAPPKGSFFDLFLRDMNTKVGAANELSVTWVRHVWRPYLSAKMHRRVALLLSQFFRSPG